MSGKIKPIDGFAEPLTLAEGATTFDWDKAERNTLKWWPDLRTKLLDGVVVYHRTVKLQQISDGLSNTYMLGEKALVIPHYEDGKASWDDQSYYLGFDQDTNLSSFSLPIVDSPFDIDVHFRFGSAHTTMFNMSFCDGSVHPVSYDIDIAVHQALGSRNGGENVDDSAL
jgi:prepilin-type processing-associated H-X9-DG protein